MPKFRLDTFLLMRGDGLLAKFLDLGRCFSGRTWAI